MSLTEPATKVSCCSSAPATRSACCAGGEMEGSCSDRVKAPLSSGTAATTSICGGSLSTDVLQSSSAGVVKSPKSTENGVQDKFCGAGQPVGPTCDLDGNECCRTLEAIDLDSDDEVKSGSCSQENCGSCTSSCKQLEIGGLACNDEEGMSYGSRNNEVLSGGLREEGQELKDRTTVDDSDSACMCCVRVLVGERRLSFPSTQSIINHVANAAIADLEARIGTLRACCKALEQYCSRRACCFVSSTATSPLSISPIPVLSNDSLSLPSPLRPEETRTPAAADTKEGIAGGEILQLEIRGMDCAHCMPKVRRALTQLPSVIPTNLDYFSGTAELRYDPETIAAAAIVGYVVRATGFGVKALASESGDGSIPMFTLPLLFPTVPPPAAFVDFDTRVGSNPRIIEVSFPIQLDGAHQPREVFQRFELLGAELVPTGYDGSRDVATRDLISISIRTVACAILSIPVLVLAWANLPHRPILYGAISTGFTTVIQILAFPIISPAFRTIFYLRQTDIDVLVAISTLTAYLFSLISYVFTAAGRPFASSFFETSALLVTLIFVGRTMSAATRRSTGSALRQLRQLQPNNALLISDQKASPRSIDTRLLHYGDIIRIFPDTRIATDGIVIAGLSDTDESSVTGESAAVTKQPGSRLIAGTLNLNGILDVRVTRLTNENSLSRITTLVKLAQSSRSPTQNLSDRFAAFVLPVAAVSACIAFLVWSLISHYSRHQSASSSVVNALTYSIAILAVSCPCAIGLAVPVVVSIAIRIGIREGILFRSADALETAHHIDVVAFDKTGTLTQGNFTVERAEILVEGAEWIINALVKDNAHPISQGVHRYISSTKTRIREGTLMDIVSLPGKGIKASLSGFPVLGGSANFTGACDHPLSSDLQISGLTIFTVTLAGQPIAFFGLADTPRPGADALVAELTRRGNNVIILSGDTPSAVHHLANAIGVPVENTFATCSPEDKDNTIAALQAKGQKVCFVGDGTNDGPALSRADIALAIGGGSDVAQTAAGAVLLGSDLRRGVLAVLDVAKATWMHARLALIWCLLYNVFAILFASGVLVRVRIEPRWAGIGEVISILPVFAIGFGLDVRWRWRRLCLATHNSD